MTTSEIRQPFSPEEKGAFVRLEGGTVRPGSTHSNLIMEHDLDRMDSMDPLVSKAGICRAKPASTEEKLATTLYRETGPIVPEIQGRMHEGGYVRASQEQVKSSVFSISNCQTLFSRGRREIIITNWSKAQKKHSYSL